MKKIAIVFVLFFLVVTTTSALAQKGGGGGVGVKENWGAIAFDGESGAWGLTYDYPDEKSASQAAMAECGERGCKVANTFVNSCGAVAYSEEYWGTGTGNTRKEAEREAKEACGQKSCAIAAWACTTR